MKKSGYYIRSLFLTICLLAVTSLTGTGQAALARQGNAQTAQETGSMIMHTVDAREIQHEQSYWTRARMQHAHTFQVERGTDQRDTDTSEAMSTRTDQVAPSDMPGVMGTQTEQTPDYWTHDRMEGAQPAKSAHTSVDQPQQPHTIQQPSKVAATAVPVKQYNTLPYSAEGKIFFTDPQTNTDYVCSGTALVSPNKSVVDTAGHCVIDGGSGNTFYTNWMFCPQRLNGTCPRGQWFARALYTTRQWLTQGDLTRDLGFAVVGLTGGKYLTDVVGSVNLIANLSAYQNFKALGYPAAPPFDGEHMYSCDSATVRRDTQIGTPPTTGIACNMTPGASGGGWLIKRNNTWYLNGHTSYGITYQPGVLYSPYFDTAVVNMFASISS